MKSSQNKSGQDTLVEINTITIEGESFFCISNSDRIRPFFMSIVSDSDHWFFISSNGGITAGRRNADYALFPYYTADKIIDSFDNTGSKSIFQITVGKQIFFGFINNCQILQLSCCTAAVPGCLAYCFSAAPKGICPRLAREPCGCRFKRFCAGKIA